MSARHRTSVLLACALLGSASAAPAARAAHPPPVASSGQLTQAYPLGPQRLCCSKPRSGSAARQGRRGTGHHPVRRSSSRGGGSSGRAAQPTGSSGLSTAVWILIGAALLVLVGVAAAWARHRRRKRAGPRASSGDGDPSRAADRGEAGALNGASTEEQAPVRARVAEDHVTEEPASQPNAPSAPSAQATDLFDRAVAHHREGSYDLAAQGYERAAQLGYPDAAFNLGVLRYEAGDLRGAESAWRSLLAVRSLGGHETQRGRGRGPAAKAATNLGYLLERRSDFSGAEAMYRDAASWGDETGARMLGALTRRRGMSHEAGSAATRGSAPS